MLRKFANNPGFKAAMSKAAQNAQSAPAGEAAATGGRRLKGITTAAAAAMRKAQEQEAEEAPRRGGLKRMASKIAAAKNAKNNPDLAKTLPQLPKFKKGGMADKSGRAMKSKTADAKGRAMKKGK
jgi:hypothetical protein